ncbi:aspartate/glutamate racemase family protein [Pelagibacterium halotolerans]|uniref:Aspartate racemase n=1 Tax=Pelagibacterium halotolerans (strain DSM 22347 / JCM 15775 / CGMCC 1.7692 / B2) TaxID=1082931 RepID=G4R698_PELHB|nr:aspartate/glutamate racemase family protein [Pelagibacterium halotolerans]AEQ53163.1 aspartate racemase [Pelagibacterium halotolerans B2]QJR17196.1 aspartate/glutamate racemase family protein [Pelagibacterium halotolerans]SEA89312.1 aspartate racemase [Pelagibacterium halotolerans]
MKTIGIIGGMSWESTAQYYALINRETARRRGGLHSAPILIDSLDFAEIEALQAKADWTAAGERLAVSAQRLETAGADMLMLATNTMHIVVPDIEAATKIPLLHIADPTADALIDDGAETVGLLGTRFTMEMDFYIDRLRQRSLDAIVPEVDRTNLDGIIYSQLCRGIINDTSRGIYQDAIEKLSRRGAQAIILGCTELGLLLSDEDSPLPLYDTTALHAARAVALALD